MTAKSTSKADELTNRIILQRFLKGGGYQSNRGTFEHLKACPDVYLVHPEAEDGMCGEGTCEFIYFAARVTCPHNVSTEYQFEMCGTLRALLAHEERVAYVEERSEPRAQLMRDLKSAIAGFQGRPDMVFLLLNGLRFPGRDGVELDLPKGRIVNYLPAESIPWLIEQGQVKPLCWTSASGEDCACDWCQLAALTLEDRDWLESFGWVNPFNEAG